MSVDEFLSLATQVILILIAVNTFISFLRSRDLVRLDITLMFVVLAFIVIIRRAQLRLNSDDNLVRYLTLLIELALVVHPYLFLRLVIDFRPIPARIHLFALGGVIISWILLLVSPLPTPLPVLLEVVIYFLVVELYSTTAFFVGARTTKGVSHWRMILAASGSGLLALVILNVGLSSLVPKLSSFFSIASQLSGLFSMLAYAAAFATPHWLRRYWQLSELQRFFRQMSGPWAGEPITSTLERLCQVAVRAVGGMEAMVALWDEEDERLVIQASTNTADLSPGRIVESKAIMESWKSQFSMMGNIPTDFNVDLTPIAVSIGAKATMIVPITTIGHHWGVIQIFNYQNSLFAADDIDLLSLFAEQTAIALGYATLVTEQQNLIRQLSQRSEQLEEAYKELESFSYSVSHDLRSPLRHISGYLEMLQKHIDPTLDSKGRRYITITLKEANRMSVLIDDLLAFSRFGRTEMYHTWVDFTKMVEEVIASFEQEQEGRDISWRVRPLPSVQGDHSLLRQVWVNLISNALKFSRNQSQMEIEVGYSIDNEELIFFVSDNGVGFNMKYANRLFGVFQRLHTSSEFDGTGIGLATVQRIIQRHGGRVWAEGEEGEGATFYFTLPKNGYKTEGKDANLSDSGNDSDLGGIRIG
ncbi:MAG: ATP-binding protein [Candidatus Promineifilaceae bacterium]